MKPKHTHKYMRIQIGGRKVVRDEKGQRTLVRTPGYEVFRCQLPNCHSHMPREVVCGSTSLCWICGDPLVLDMENTKLQKPTHVHCRKIREIAV